MKSKIVKRLLGPLAFVVAVAVPAGAQAASTEFEGFLCELDLSGIKNKPPGVPDSVFTFDSRKHCPGNNKNITIECRASIPEWTGKASSNKNVPCRINGNQCGVPDFMATKSTLTISASGNAHLFCKR
jgi:hypothetical protein